MKHNVKREVDERRQDKRSFGEKRNLNSSMCRETKGREGISKIHKTRCRLRTKIVKDE